jgi:hypothetical protein
VHGGVPDQGQQDEMAAVQHPAQVVSFMCHRL